MPLTKAISFYRTNTAPLVTRSLKNMEQKHSPDQYDQQYSPHQYCRTFSLQGVDKVKSTCYSINSKGHSKERSLNCPQFHKVILQVKVSLWNCGVTAPHSAPPRRPEGSLIYTALDTVFPRHTLRGTRERHAVTNFFQLIFNILLDVEDG